MDYVYHYYNNWDHGTYGQSSSSSSFTGHCSCTCFTCLYKLDLLLLLIVIYLMLMDKITININSSTITTTTTRLPLVPVNDNGTIITPSPTNNMSNIVTSTTESISSSSLLSSSPSSSISSSPNKSLSSTSSAFVKVKTSLINSSLPWESMIITKSHGGETLINSERSTPSDPPESLPDSLNSFCSYGSLRRKLIKPDISLDFLDSSSDEDDDNEDDKSSKSKKKSSDDTDSLEECNVFSGCANDEHFYRDASLSEETFTNDRMIVHPSSIHCS